VYLLLVFKKRPPVKGEPSIPGRVWSNRLVHISQAPTKAVRLGGGCLTLAPTLSALMTSMRFSPAPRCRNDTNFSLSAYTSNALNFFVAVGNLPRPAFITSSARVKYRSPKVPVILECRPVASRPA